MIYTMITATLALAAPPTRRRSELLPRAEVEAPEETVPDAPGSLERRVAALRSLGAPEDFAPRYRTTCEPCPAAHFCVAMQKQSFSRATQCVPGEHVVGNVSAVSDRSCAICPVGTFSTASNANTCQPCPQGKFQAQRGATACASYHR